MNIQDKTKEELIVEIQETSFMDIFNLADIQHLQDLFADAHGVASIITDMNGNPITQPSNFTRLCEKIIRKTEKGCANCLKSDAVIGRHNPSGAIVQTCLSCGLWDAGASINVGGKHIANWLIGQVRNEQVDEQRMMRYAGEISADIEDFEAALLEVPFMSLEQFHKTADLLFVFANELSAKGFSNLQLSRLIAEKEKAIASLQQREENLLITLHSIGDGVISTDINGLIVSMNPVAERLCGWKLTEASGKPLADVFSIIDTETRLSAANPVKEVLDKGEIVGLANHTALVSRNGTEYQIADSAAPIMNKNGEITGVVLVFSDVTEKYAAQKQIKESEERYRSLLNNLDAGIVVHAPDTSIVINNTRASELLGLSNDQMKGKAAIDQAWKFTHEDNTPLTLDEYPVNRIVNGRQSIKNQVLGIQQPGKNDVVWVTVNGFPVLDTKGEITEVVISFIDITDRIQAEEKIKLSEEKFSKSFFNSPDSIIINRLDDGKIVTVNNGFRKIMGYEDAEVTGKTTKELNFYKNPEERNAIISALKTTGQALDIECWFITKHGEERLGLLSAAIIDIDGVKHIMSTSRDVTDRKKSELLLREKTEEIEAQNEEYQQINEELTQTNQEIAEARKNAEINEARLKMAMEVSKSGAWDWDILKNTFYWSDEFLQLFGLPENTIAGFDAWTKALHPDDVEGAATKIQEAIENHTELLNDYRIILPNSEIRWIRATGHATYLNNKPARMIGLCMDVTYLKQTEKALNNREILLNKVFDLLPIGLWFADENGRLLRGNPAGVKIWGAEPTVSIEEYGVFKARRYPSGEEIEPDDWALAHTIREGVTIMDEQLEIEAFDGQKKIILNYAAPVLDDQGNIQGAIIVNQDITQQKRLEEVHTFLSTSGYPGSNETFFESLAKYLSDILDSEYVCIDKLEGDGLTAQTVAIYNEGKFDPNVSYTLKQTPCGDVVGKTICCFPENVCQLFPHDEALQTLNAHSYIGTTLWSFDGKPIGLIAIIGQKPLKNADFAENVLKLVAIRAAGELERLQAEDGLKMAKLKAEESEEFFRNIFENSPVGKSITGLDGSLKTNKAFSDMLGYSFEEFQSKNYKDITHPDDIKKATDAVETLLRGEESVIQFEKKYIHKNGSVIFSEVVTTLQKNRDGKPLFFITSVSDITERKQAEKSLKESEERFKNMFERHSSIMLLVDPESGMILNANDASARFYGYSKAELLAMPIDQINILSPEQVKTEREHAVSEERSYFVFPHKLANGEVRTVEVHSSPIVFQDQKILFSIIHDITDRKQAEHELQLAMEIAEVNTANITAIIEGTANSIWAFNEHFEIVYINQVFKRDFYQTFGIWLDPGASLINSLPEVIRPFWKKRYDRVLNNEQFTVEDAVDTENGIVYIQVTFNPIVIKGQVIGGSCFGNNITLRKLAEIELLKAKEHAQESDRLKSAFLANMSHEIRTPMNGILGFASLLKEPDLTGEDQQKYVRIIEKSGARMLNIINDIVDISKIEAGLMEVNLKESNINDQIEYIYTFFKPEIEGKGMRLSFKSSLPEKDAIIITDREKVYAILTNLIKNAIKYTIGGSIDFGYDLVKTQHAASLQFFVKDTGIGIAENRQEAIFERFIQADIEDPRALQGAGLGLTISKAYVEMLGGKIWVNSEEGIGSTFYFTIPYNTKKQGQSDIENVVSAEDIDIQIKTLKILIADDDETSDFLITSMLKKNNHEILHTKTGIETIEACRNNPDIDLVLMDIRMPKINGYEATSQIRQFNHEVIIIAQTANGLLIDRQKALDAGCNEYLSKPIKKDELLRLMQKYFLR